MTKTGEMTRPERLYAFGEPDAAPSLIVPESRLSEGGRFTADNTRLLTEDEAVALYWKGTHLDPYAWPSVKILLDLPHDGVRFKYFWEQKR
jgi:hypothetical protein